MERVSYSHLKKLLTCQPFFIWNSWEKAEYDEGDDSELVFDLPSFQDPISASYTEVQLKAFGRIESAFDEYVKTQYPSSIKVLGKSLDEKIETTQKLMNDDDVNIIQSPIFSFERSGFEVIASPSLYIKDKAKVVFLKISTSTKLADIIRPWFDIHVMREGDIKVKDASLAILATKEYKKGEVSFFETNYINTTSSGRSDSDAKAIRNFRGMQVKKAGQGTNKNGKYDEGSTIIELIDKKSKVRDIINKSFDMYIDVIVSAKDAPKPKDIEEADRTSIGFNPNFNELVEKFQPHFSGVSGNLVSKSAIAKGISLEEAMTNSPTFCKIITSKEVIVKSEAIVSSIVENLYGNVVWYDFEAFSLPYSPMDGILPFQQVVSQVSVIITDGLVEKEVSNLVVDPKNVSLDDFVKIIDAIHHDNHSYVVYNKGYENARLKEMVSLLHAFDHVDASRIDKLVDQIIASTVDLATPFVATKKKLPVILVPELKGRHSIKLLEKYITHHRKDIAYQIKEYKNLKIQNGMMAMETANNRAMGIIGNTEWNAIVDQLKEYCENDVRAMIMVFHLIKSLDAK